jgi:hypothetical protein
MREQLLVYFVEQQKNLLQEENSTVGFRLPPPVYITPGKFFVQKNFQVRISFNLYNIHFILSKLYNKTRDRIMTRIERVMFGLHRTFLCMNIYIFALNALLIISELIIWLILCQFNQY